MGMTFYPPPNYGFRPEGGLSARRRVQLAAVLLIVALVAWRVVHARQARYQPYEAHDSVPASAAQIAQFEDILSRYEQLIVAAQVTGDTTLYPSVLYNDGALELHPDCVSAIASAGAAVGERLAATHTGPIGANTGWLSCEVAIVVEHEQWLATKVVEIALTPPPNGGMDGPALMRSIQSESPNAPEAYIWDVRIAADGRHATLKRAYDPQAMAESKDAPLMIEHIVFTAVDGQWYISQLWSSGTWAG
jgi:hypothetical protein